MTTGSMLYLLMSTGMFVVFSAVLAYESWQQARLGPEVSPTSAPTMTPEPGGAVHA
jgi:FtsH-binding integral membrane protein